MEEEVGLEPTRLYESTSFFRTSALSDFRHSSETILLVDHLGLEPRTQRLKAACSTIELMVHKVDGCERQDSNLRPLGYEPNELSTAPLRNRHLTKIKYSFARCNVLKYGLKCFSQEVLNLDVQSYIIYIAHFNSSVHGGTKIVHQD